jgi:hypothetical protein
MEGCGRRTICESTVISIQVLLVTPSLLPPIKKRGRERERGGCSSNDGKQMYFTYIRGGRKFINDLIIH